MDPVSVCQVCGKKTSDVYHINWISSTAVGFLLFLAAKALASWLGHG